jgi:hypothetical protein
MDAAPGAKTNQGVKSMKRSPIAAFISGVMSLAVSTFAAQAAPADPTRDVKSEAGLVQSAQYYHHHRRHHHHHHYRRHHHHFFHHHHSAWVSRGLVLQRLRTQPIVHIVAWHARPEAGSRQIGKAQKKSKLTIRGGASCRSSSAQQRRAFYCTSS